MPEPDLLRAVLGAAESAVGVNYVWGGNSLARGVDCSGLVQQAFRAAGIAMPRVSNAQANVGQQIGSINEAQPGDLLSWDNSSRNNGADHIAIYLGNGMMIEAPRRGAKVQVVPVSSRGGVRVNRVLGVVAPSADPELRRNLEFGPNQDRQYTNAAVEGAPAPTPTAAQSVVDEGNPGGGLGDGLPPNATTEQTVAYIQENFPSVAPFLANDEIKMLLFAAAKEDWSAQKLDQALQQTEYYKTHDVTSRNFDLLLGTDRATATTLINRKIVEVDQAFQRQGVTKDKAELGEIAKGAIRGGWTAEDLERHVANELAKAPLPDGSDASADADTLVARARENLIPISRADAEKWALNITAGRATQDSFDSWVAGIARARYAAQPDILAAIESGSTVSQYYAAHRATVASTLELDDEQIDLLDPKWSWALETVDKQGNRRAPTLGEVAQLARDRPEFAKTRQYKSTVAEYGLGASKFLGAAA